MRGEERQPQDMAGLVEALGCTCCTSTSTVALELPGSKRVKIFGAFSSAYACAPIQSAREIFLKIGGNTQMSRLKCSD